MGCDRRAPLVRSRIILSRRASLLVMAVLAARSPVPAQPAGGEVRVNSYTPGVQRNARVALDGSGRFVVVWESYGEDGSGYGIFGQRYAAGGTPAGTAFRVSTYTSSHQAAASVAVNRTTGAFVVVWRSPGADMPVGSNGIYAQRYDASGAALGGEFRVNTTTTASDDAPSVATDVSGNFLVTWAALPDAQVARGIFGRLFQASGAPVGDEFRVSPGSSSLTSASASADGSGTFIVVWDDGTGRVAGRRFDSAGQPLGADFRLNTGTTGVELIPGVAAFSSGGFVAVWGTSFADAADPSGGIFAQRFSKDEVRLGDVFHVNTYTTNIQNNPRVAGDPLGSFVVCWNGTDAALGTSSNVQAQRYRSTGAPIGGESRVNTTLPLMQLMGGLAANAVGDFVVVWESNADGQKDIYFQRYAPISRHGDVDGNGVVEVLDVFYLINALFAGGPAPIGTADSNADALVDVSDVFYLINYLFAGGPAPQ